MSDDWYVVTFIVVITVVSLIISFTTKRNFAIMDGWYHWKDNWFWKRGDDGSVLVEHRQENLTQAIEIPPDEWASIVASVSHRGDSGDAYHEALLTHNKASDAV